MFLVRKSSRNAITKGVDAAVAIPVAKSGEDGRNPPLTAAPITIGHNGLVTSS